MNPMMQKMLQRYVGGRPPSGISVSVRPSPKSESFGPGGGMSSGGIQEPPPKIATETEPSQQTNDVTPPPSAGDFQKSFEDQQVNPLSGQQNAMAPGAAGSVMAKQRANRMGRLPGRGIGGMASLGKRLP